jgi:glycosyltransferase involved in cell wall biosynthesis
MTEVVHVVARAVADDPHTLAVLALADAMSERRFLNSHTVFAAEGAHAVDGVEPVAEMDEREPSLLVYHQRGAAPALVSRLTQRAIGLAVVADDVPPDPLARRDLRVLATAGAFGLATSDDTASRLEDLDFGRVSRVPPVVARDGLVAVAPYAPTMHHLDVTLHGPLVLTVGDLATAGSTARVVQAYDVLRTYLVRAGHLAIAIPEASDTSEAAVRRVYREVWGLRLTEAWANRLVNMGERAALTRRAAVFATTDPASGDVRHALAAMAEGVPVVAAADASAAGVLGDGALILPPDATATLVAEAVAELLHDESRRASFAAAAARVVAGFAPETVAPAWRAALAA